MKRILIVNLPDTKTQINRTAKLITTAYHIAVYINGTWRSGWEFPTEGFIWKANEL